MDIFESLRDLNVSEECFNDIIDIVEELIAEYWEKNPTYKSRFTNGGYKMKQVEMSPDDYIKKSAQVYRRKGMPYSQKTAVKHLETSRNQHTTQDGTSATSDYSKKIQSKDTSVNPPFLLYDRSGDKSKDLQDGLHRAVASKNMGTEKIPVNIFYGNTGKKTPLEKKQNEVKSALKERRIQRNRNSNYRKMNAEGQG